MTRWFWMLKLRIESKKGSLMKQISFAKPSKSVQHDTLVLEVETQNWIKKGFTHEADFLRKTF